MTIQIILEAGVNHNGNLNRAKKMIDVASKAGANFIKFQTFKAKNLVTQKAPKALYQKKYTGEKESQYKMLKKFETENEMEEGLDRITDYSQFGSYAELIKINKFRYKNPREE